MKFSLPKVSVQAHRIVVGADGRPRNERRTFSQVLSPINLRADGMPKTRTDVLEELLAIKARWVAQHSECHPAERLRSRRPPLPTARICGKEPTGILIDELAPTQLFKNGTMIVNGTGRRS